MSGAFQSQYRVMAATRATEAVAAGHVDHGRADAVAEHALGADLPGERDHVFEQDLAETAAAHFMNDAEAEIGFAIADAGMGKGDDAAVGTAQSGDIVLLVIQARDISGNAGVGDAVAEAQGAVSGVETEQVPADTLGIGGGEALQGGKIRAGPSGRSRCRRRCRELGGGRCAGGRFSKTNRFGHDGSPQGKG